jgi:excisionase family DNA binding protein
MPDESRPKIPPTSDAKLAPDEGAVTISGAITGVTYQAAIGTSIIGTSIEITIAYLTLAEAAKIARVSSSTLRRHARSGELRADKVRGRWMTGTGDVVNFLESRQGAGQPGRKR